MIALCPPLISLNMWLTGVVVGGNPAVLLQTMDPAEPRRNMPVPGEPGSPEERYLCRLSNGMTLEGNHFVSTALDTVAALSRIPLVHFWVHLQPWRSFYISSTCIAQLLSLKAFFCTIGLCWIRLRQNPDAREQCPDRNCWVNSQHFVFHWDISEVCTTWILRKSPAPVAHSSNSYITHSLLAFPFLILLSHSLMGASWDHLSNNYLHSISCLKACLRGIPNKTVSSTFGD